MNWKAKFTPTNNDHSYYPLLFMALEEMGMGKVIEMGMGYGSTPILHDYLSDLGNLFSYDSKEEWASKFYHLISKSHHIEVVTNWDVVFKNHVDADLIFIDHAPGERRKVDLELFKDTQGIIVIHDTEPTGAGDYRVRPLFDLFKYKAEVETSGAWATALSNKIDITKWKGERFGEYVIS